MVAEGEGARVKTKMSERDLRAQQVQPHETPITTSSIASPWSSILLLRAGTPVPSSMPLTKRFSFPLSSASSLTCSSPGDLN